MLLSASDKAKFFAENFSKNSNLDDSGFSLPVFHSRTNLKLHNISATPKMVNLSKASGPDCKPSCPDCISVIHVFQIVGRFLWIFLYIKIVGKGLQLKTTPLLIFFLCSVKSLKNL